MPLLPISVRAGGLRGLAMLSLLAVSLVPVAAQTSPSRPTTKILAIGTLPQSASPERRRDIMPREVRDTLQLYLAGKIDQWYSKQDGSGVVFLLNVSNRDEARQLLEALPLGQAHMMDFQLISLGPLAPLGMLSGAVNDAGPLSK